MSRIVNYGATSPMELNAAGSFQTSTDVNLATLVGTRWDTSDGREVLLVSNGATAIASAGLLVQTAAVVPNHMALVVTGFTAYSANGNTPASVAVTLGATALTAGQYAGGLLTVNTGPGIGQTLRIASNPGALSSGTNVVIVLEDAPNVALTTSSTVSLWPQHGSNVVVNPTTPTNVPAGITFYPIAAGQAAGGTSATANSYAFVVCKGFTAAVSDSTAPAVGADIGASTTTAGTIGSGTIGTSFGYTAIAATSAQAKAVFVSL